MRGGEGRGASEGRGEERRKRYERLREIWEVMEGKDVRGGGGGGGGGRI